MNCIFCKIINGEIPCYKLYEDDLVLCFLDVNPLSNGHTLVVTKKHFKDLYDIDKYCIDELKTLLDNIANCDCINKLMELLDNIEDPKFFKGQNPLLLTKKYAFLPQYENSDKEKSDSSIKSYSFQERVVMYGICLYLQYAKIDKDNIDSFKHWLRVLSNLAYYKELPTYSSYRTRLKFIKGLVDKLVYTSKSFPDIYSNNAVRELESLSNSSDGDDEVNDNKKQLQEEIIKIGKIKSNDKAEEILEKLESLWIFSGNIDCLLDNDLFNNDKIYETISGYIGENPTTFLRDNDKLISLFQAILAKTEDEDLKDVEVMKFNDEHDGLRKLLNGTLRVPLQKVLKDNIDTIINEYNNNDWKYALIKDKRLWNYAAKGILKKDDNGKHYLYKGTYKNDADILLEGYNAFIRKSNNNIEQSTTTQIEFKDKKWYIDNHVIENWEKHLTTNTLINN